MVVLMNAHLILGLFALYVVAVTLCRVLSGSDETRLSLVRRIWGRTHGLGLYFAVHVVLPLLVGVLCMGQGVASYTPAETSVTSQVQHLFSLDLDSKRAMMALRRLGERIDHFILSP